MDESSPDPAAPQPPAGPPRFGGWDQVRLAQAAPPAPGVAHSSAPWLAPREPRPLPARQVVQPVGLAATGIGAVLVLIAYTAASWFSAGRSIFHVSIDFNTLGDGIRQAGLSHVPAKDVGAAVYYAFGGWVLFALVIVCGIVANLDLAMSYACRVLTIALGLTAVVWTIVAIVQPVTDTHGPLGPGVSWGGPVAAVGFLVVALGGLVAR